MSASLLPPNATALERAIEAAGMRLDALPVPFRDLWSAERCPLPLLPWLAWALSIDTWDSDWPENVKRARVATAIEIQRRKGTRASIEAIVRVFGGAIAMREWWETAPKGTPHTFDLVLSLAEVHGAAPTGTYIDQVIDEIARTKPARSHFTFTLATDAAGAIGLIGRARSATLLRLQMAA